MNEQKLAEQIGRRFREFRLNQGLRQKEISTALGTSHSNISRLERGAIQRFSLVFLKNCQLKFGLSIDWLLTGQGLMLSPEVEFKAGLPSDSSHQKGGKERYGRGSTLAKQTSLLRKLNPPA